jgi:replicative DNA helicase
MAALGTELGVGIRDVKRGNLSHSQMEKINRLISAKAFEGVDVVSASGWTVEQVKACAKRHQRKRGLSCILVDMGAHLRTGLESHGRVEHLEAVSKGLFSMAKELDVLVINTHQINRASTENDGMKPELHNLKGSGAIEEDADLVLMLHRPGYFGSADKRTEIAVKKDRLSGGAGQSCFVVYDKYTGRFKAAIPEA